MNLRFEGSILGTSNFARLSHAISERVRVGAYG